MSDLINRQDAIVAFWKIEEKMRPSAIYAVTDMLKNLPPAQPEIIYCKDCKKCQADVLFNEYWCEGCKVSAEHYCGYAERKENG